MDFFFEEQSTTSFKIKMKSLVSYQSVWLENHPVTPADAVCLLLTSLSLALLGVDFSLLFIACLCPAPGLQGLTANATRLDQLLGVNKDQ